jgi:hypothetical protein
VRRLGRRQKSSATQLKTALFSVLVRQERSLLRAPAFEAAPGTETLLTAVLPSARPIVPAMAGASPAERSIPGASVVSPSPGR